MNNDLFTDEKAVGADDPTQYRSTVNLMAALLVATSMIAAFRFEVGETHARVEKRWKSAFLRLKPERNGHCAA